MTEMVLVELIKRCRKWPTISVSKLTNEEILALANIVAFSVANKAGDTIALEHWENP